VVGGRNIGDEYLGAETPVAFTDLDVLAIGPVVPEVSSVFDRYWNSEAAWPAAALLPPPSDVALAQTRAQWAHFRSQPKATRYLEAVRQLPLLAQMMDGTLALDWVPAEVLADAPEKVLVSTARKDVQMMPRLIGTFGDASRELALVSPYFVPGEAGAETLVEMARRGVQVQVLTNSLAATDVGVVYSGYARYRARLLRGGVRLYELKPAARPPEADDAPRAQGIGGSRGGSSSASLHAKTFAADGDRIFVGSFNLDPRSVALNTEMGVLLGSPKLAGRLSDAFRTEIPRDAYELKLEGGQMVWVERTDAGEVHHPGAPGIGFVRGLWIALLALLPIEWLL
jgi:putative cardiolipin synthase